MSDFALPRPLSLASPEITLASGEFHVATDLILALARGLHEAGQPAHRVEVTLSRVAERLGIPLQVLVLPSVMVISFQLAAGPATYVHRVAPRGVQLERLVRLTRIADDLVRRRITPMAAHIRIEDAVRTGTAYSWWARLSAYVLSAAAFSVFFGGGWNELLVAIAVGLAVGSIAVGLRSIQNSSRLFELTAAAAATFIASEADWVIGAYSGWIPLASGLIMLLPGMGLVDAVEELANGFLASGSARLAGVGVVFLALTFGVVLGSKVASLLPDAPAIDNLTGFPPWALAPAVLAVTVGSTIRFHARPQDGLVILAASIVALVGSRGGSALVGGDLAGPFVAASLLGLLANGYARLARQAGELVIVPGLAILVPGSVGYRSMEALLSENTAVGVDAAFHMFMVAMALVAGLLFSTSLTRESSAAA